MTLKKGNVTRHGWVLVRLILKSGTECRKTRFPQMSALPAAQPVSDLYSGQCPFAVRNKQTNTHTTHTHTYTHKHTHRGREKRLIFRTRQKTHVHAHLCCYSSKQQGLRPVSVCTREVKNRSRAFNSNRNRVKLSKLSLPLWSLYKSVLAACRNTKWNATRSCFPHRAADAHA